RRRPALHRGAPDARPAGRRGAADGRRPGRADRHAGRFAGRHAGCAVAQRTWDDYSIGRADTNAHLAALDIVYSGVVEAHREAIEKTEEPDPVTEDMLVGQTGQLEQFHWFVRAHLENESGTLLTEGVRDEKTAARKGKR